MGKGSEKIEAIQQQYMLRCYIGIITCINWRHYSLGNSIAKKNVALIIHDKLKMNQQCFKIASTSLGPK